MGYVVVEIDHTADTAIQVTADRIEDLYAGAAEAMFSVTARVPEHVTGESRTFVVEGRSRVDLLWNMLSELLSEAEADDVVLHEISVVLDGHAATVTASAVPLGRAEVVGPPVKAVTWHGLDITKKGDEWVTTLVFDI